MIKVTRTKKRIRDPILSRQNLLQATLDLIAEKGIDALSMKDVAERANLSRSAAYLHFADREQLLEEAKKWIYGRLQDSVRAVDDSTSLYEHVLETTRLILQYPELSKVMIMDALAGGALDLQDPLFNAISARLKKNMGRKSGKVRSNIDVEISTYIHLGSIASTLFLWEQHKDDDIESVAARFAKEWSRILEDGLFIS